MLPLESIVDQQRLNTLLNLLTTFKRKVDVVCDPFIDLASVVGQLDQEIRQFIRDHIELAKTVAKLRADNDNLSRQVAKEAKKEGKGTGQSSTSS